MAIAPGTYYITVDTVGGLPRFATDNGVGKEITVKGGDPAPSPRQKWYVKPTETRDVYTITAGAHPPLPGAPGFRREKGARDVLNAPLPGEWRILPVKGEPHVFHVYPTDIWVGGQELLGTDKDKVVIQRFPIGTRSEELPSWNFAYLPFE